MSGHEDEATPIGDEAAWAALEAVDAFRATRDEIRALPVSGEFTVTNAEGVAAVHQVRRDRKRQRDLGVCCRNGDPCPTCELEAEAKYADD